MFEVGKFSEESLDSLLEELGKVSKFDAEGEAEKYFSIAVTLRETILFLRQNPALKSSVLAAQDDGTEADNMTLGLDLLRCESLHSLDASTVDRLMKKNYS